MSSSVAVRPSGTRSLAGLLWQRASGRDEIQLHGGREMPISLAWRGPDALAPLDLQGRPAGDAAAVLRRLGSFAPADLQLSLHGDFHYLAGVASFEECLTGRRYPVAMEGDFVALERAYRESPAGSTADRSSQASTARSPRGRPWRVALPRPPSSCAASSACGPGKSCERAMSRASLAETYWRIVRLRGEAPVTAGGGVPAMKPVRHEPTPTAARTSRCQSSASAQRCCCSPQASPGARP